MIKVGTLDATIPRNHPSRAKRMQATDRMASVVSSALPARHRLILERQHPIQGPPPRRTVREVHMNPPLGNTSIQDFSRLAFLLCAIGWALPGCERPAARPDQEVVRAAADQANPSDAPAT